MHQQHRDTDTERDPETIVYHRAACPEHPDPERPRRHAPAHHHRSREVAIGGDPVRSRELFADITPETCRCGAAVAADCRTAEWPPIPITTAAAVGLLRRLDGFVALRVRALGYPAEPVDWQSLVGLEDPARDRDWYLGLVGDRLVARTRIDYEPIWSATAVTPADVGVLLRRLPSEPVAIWRTNLDGHLEDYQAGREPSTGVSVASVTPRDPGGDGRRD